MNRKIFYGCRSRFDARGYYLRGSARFCIFGSDSGRRICGEGSVLNAKYA